MSSPSAPITGATAAIAELPQIELPQAIRIAMRNGKPSMRQMMKLEPSRDGDDGGDSDEKNRPKRQHGRNAHRRAQHDDRDFKQELCGKRDAGNEALCRRPSRADGNAEQDRKHERFQISLAGEMDLDGLQQDRHERYGDAEQDARRQSAQILDQITAPCKIGV